MHLRLLRPSFAEPQHTNRCTFTQLDTHTQVMLYHNAVHGCAVPGVMCSWRWGRLAAAGGVTESRLCQLQHEIPLLALLARAGPTHSYW